MTTTETTLLKHLSNYEKEIIINALINSTHRGAGKIDYLVYNDRYNWLFKQTDGFLKKQPAIIKVKRAWYDMIKRCYNKKAAKFKYYGGRNISVCDEWCKSFYIFLRDMGVPPFPKMSLDRINNDKGYSKINCRWATHSTQMRNCSQNKKIGQYSLDGILINTFNCARVAADSTGTNYYSIVHILNKTGGRTRKTANKFIWKIYENN